MSAETFALTVHGDEYEARLTVPEEPDGRGVVVLPGAGHGPWGDIFDRFAAAAADDGSHVLRFDGWPTAEEFMAQTVAEIHAEIDAAVDRLRAAGCTELGLVGKSFGGGVALTHDLAAFDRVALWAPAFVTFGDEETVSDSLAVPLGEMEDAPERRQIAPSTLADLNATLLVVQGDGDEVRSLDHARRIVEAAPDAALVVREGEDHSFRGADREREVVAQTVAFLGDGGGGGTSDSEPIV